MNRIQIRWQYVVSVLGIVAIIFLVKDFSDRMSNFRRQQRAADLVSTERAGKIATMTALQTAVAEAGQGQIDPSIVGELKVGQEGDVVIVPVPVGSQATPTPEPLPLPTPITNWQLWMALFIDP